MTANTIVVRIDRDVHRWLMDHRTYEEKSISDVIQKLILQKKQRKSDKQDEIIISNIEPNIDNP